MSFISRYSSSSKDNDPIEVHLIRGESTDNVKTYSYILIYASMVRDLNLSLMTKTTDLNKFGVIVASGSGEPDDKTKKYIQETFLDKNDGIE